MPHRRLLKQEHQLDQRAESELGRMCLREQITRAMFLAGDEYGRVVGRYRAVISPPRTTTGLGRGYACLGELDCQNCECARRKVAYKRAYEVISGVGHKAHIAINAVVVCDERCPIELQQYLIWGLKALVKHFGLTDGNKSGMAKIDNPELREFPPAA